METLQLLFLNRIARHLIIFLFLSFRSRNRSNGLAGRLTANSNARPGATRPCDATNCRRKRHTASCHPLDSSTPTNARPNWSTRCAVTYAGTLRMYHNQLNSSQIFYVYQMNNKIPWVSRVTQDYDQQHATTLLQSTIGRSTRWSSGYWSAALPCAAT